MYFLIRVLINALAVWVATRIVPGIELGAENYIATLFLVAIIFGVVNAVIKPILATMTCPLYILTLGLFTFVINALMLWLTSVIATALGLRFTVDGFVAALLGAIVVSVVSFVLSLVLNEDRMHKH